MVERVNSVPRSRFVNLVVGIAIAAERCVAEQEAIVSECRIPLIRAVELNAVVTEAMP